MSNRRSFVATGAIDRVFEDASGAPGRYWCGGYQYAVDYLGGPRVTCITPCASSRRASRGAEIVECRYLVDLNAATDANWIQRNQALYAEVA